ncbi:CYTH and CHAD domain-containing protein [Arthrobacter sp. ok362]|uniref:CYTH and CHAD domain-containing protein n=1 Tax=Arthrobacter sp. ok362 TaxID=1761745 RepID=UPI0008842B0D|nr:CYTH and CHAD domain-containing protein [Arthrobacter sp. ok362]SDL06257.1 CHAD domain-containing protein [Arthrobacter sp. ok362]
METTGKLETEQKYDAETSSTLPDLPGIQGVDHVAEPVTDHLEAVYFDTPALTLAARRLTLRRRTGGADAGWHLKLPAGTDQREEIHAPLGQPETVPEELSDRLQVFTRGDELVPVARLSTRRTTYRLYGPEGEHLADFADDLVHAEALQPPGPALDWREWELELVHGTREFLDATAETLTSTGAGHSAYPSKLARTFGDAWPAELSPRTGKPRKKLRKKGPAADVVTAYLDARIEDYIAHDPGVRLGTPDSVHKMRSATRRARSALATYRKLFNRAAVRELQAELKWLGQILGPARDAEVMLERLRQHLVELPEEQRSGSLNQMIELELVAAHNAGYRNVLQTLQTDRYFRLLGSLEDFRDHPPAKPRAFRPARKVTGKLVNKAAKRVERSRKAVKRSAGRTAGDTALHEVRKDAKRLRHAGESVMEIHGKRAVKLTKSAGRLQSVLGDHQDSVMATALLRRLAAIPDLPVDADLGLQSLLEMEERIARKTEKKARKAGKKLRGLRLRS